MYLLGVFTDTEVGSTLGISVIADMQAWGWPNFGISYAQSFFDALIGRFPCRIRGFYIVTPPRWFGMVWKLIYPMMGADFAQKVHILKDTKKLVDFVKDTGQLPVQMGGNADTEHILKQFITWRRVVESE